MGIYFPKRYMLMRIIINNISTEDHAENMGLDRILCGKLDIYDILCIITHVSFPYPSYYQKLSTSVRLICG
jgi:hypothetical protein